MLEQNEKTENGKTIEDSNNIDDKYSRRGEELMESKGNKGIKPRFIDAFKASFIDIILVGVISTAGVYASDMLLKLSGFSITQKFQMSFIVFVVVMLLYMSIMESGKKSATIGKKIAGLIITRR